MRDTVDHVVEEDLLVSDGVPVTGKEEIDSVLKTFNQLDLLVIGIILDAQGSFSCLIISDRNR